MISTDFLFHKLLIFYRSPAFLRQLLSSSSLSVCPHCPAALNSILLHSSPTITITTSPRCPPDLSPPPMHTSTYRNACSNANVNANSNSIAMLCLPHPPTHPPNRSRRCRRERAYRPCHPQRQTRPMAPWASAHAVQGVRPFSLGVR